MLLEIVEIVSEPKEDTTPVKFKNLRTGEVITLDVSTWVVGAMQYTNYRGYRHENGIFHPIY